MSQALAYFGCRPNLIVNLPIPGANGSAGKFPVIIQYSIDGLTGWNITPMPGAQYIQMSVDDGVTYGDAVLFAGTGAQGPQGIQGQQGVQGPQGAVGPAGSLVIPGGGTARLSGSELQLWDASANGWRALMIVGGVFTLGNPVS